MYKFWFPTERDFQKINILESPENIICFSVVTDVEQTAALNSQETSCEVSLHKQVPIENCVS